MKHHSPTLVFASVLKPCQDVRMYQKLAKSISGDGACIHLVGNASENTVEPLFKCHPIFKFKRISFNRIFTEVRFFLLLLQLKPSVVVFCTYELMLASVLYKWLHGGKILYDVQENYSANIATGPLRPVWLRKLASRYVLVKQSILAPFINHFLLAEACYASELAFVGDRGVLIENKVLRSVCLHAKPKPNKGLHICITGTIGHTYGSLEAITCLKNIMLKDPDVYLKIIGFCADASYLKQVRSAVGDNPNIELACGSLPLGHDSLLEAISSSHFSIMFYEDNESFRNKIPTKFYECIALNTQVVTSSIPLWNEFLTKHNAGFCVDRGMDTTLLLTMMYAAKNRSCVATDDIFFDKEKQILSKLIK